jgi:hypothetical protein
MLKNSCYSIEFKDGYDMKSVKNSNLKFLKLMLRNRA